MKLFLKRRSGEKCRAYCDAYDVAYAAASKLHAECQVLSDQAEMHRSIAALMDKGAIILGMSQVNHHVVATTLAHDAGRTRTICLQSLSDHSHSRPICHMDMKYISKYRIAHIQDWQCELEDMGYGSALMTHLIAYLKLSGYRCLTGYICPTDFSHEDKLRHFYTKFGFKIKDYPDKRALKLWL